MHELSNRGIVPIGPVHIEDMRTIPKPFAAFDKATLDLIDSFPQADHIILCDEDDIGFWQRLEVIALFQQIHVHHAAVIPRPFSACAFVRALNFDVEFSPFAVGRQNVQADGTVEQIFHEDLRSHIDYVQVRFVQHDLQDQLNARGVIVKAFGEKIIVYQPQLA